MPPTAPAPARRRVPAAIATAWLALALLPACAPKPIRAIYEKPFAAGEDRALFLTAARQKDRIERALVAAGFSLAEDPLGTRAHLRVTIGNEKRLRDCGSLNNVKFALRLDGEPVLELAAAGWTGSCEPNVLDDMSRDLARRFATQPR